MELLLSWVHGGRVPLLSLFLFRDAKSVSTGETARQQPFLGD